MKHSKRRGIPVKDQINAGSIAMKGFLFALNGLLVKINDERGMHNTR
jgi:hypothetical protein